MARRILVVPATTGAGVTAACLGLAQSLRSRRVAVAFAKPFEQDRGRGEDQSTELFRLTMALRPPQPVPASVLAEGLAAGRLLSTMSAAISVTEELDESNRVLILEGLAPTAGQPMAERINIELAQAYDAEVILVGSAEGHEPEQLADRMATLRRTYLVRGEDRVIGVVVNRLPGEADVEAYRAALTQRGMRIVAMVGSRPELTHRRVSDIVRELGLGVVRDGEQGRRVAGIEILAQSAPGFIDFLNPDRLLLTPGDRHDVLMAAALAEAGGTRLAAVVLTGGIEPDQRVLDLCEAAAPSRLPILSTHERTFETAQHLLALSSEVPGDDEDRARSLMQTFADAYDEDWIDSLPRPTRPTRITPAQFTRRAAAHAGVGLTRVAVADGTDPRALRAVTQVDVRSQIQCFVVGDPDTVDTVAEQNGLRLPAQVRVVDPAAPGEDITARIAETITSTGLNMDPRNPMLVALALQAAGEVDGVVGGLDLTRAQFMEAVRAFVPRGDGGATVCGSQFVEMPDEVLVYADTVNLVEPDAEQLAAIAGLTADTAVQFGLEPRIAFIRPSSSSPRATEQADRIDAAMELLRQRRPDLPTRGPVAYGTATSRTPEFTDSGENATVLVFPEIASAAATVRVAAGTVGAHVHPPLLQGLPRAVNPLLRTAGVRDVEEVIIATAVQVNALA